MCKYVMDSATILKEYTADKILSTDGQDKQTNCRRYGRTDRQTDKVKPVYLVFLVQDWCMCLIKYVKNSNLLIGLIVAY